MPISILLASNDPSFSFEIKSELQLKHEDIKVYMLGEAGAENAELAACWHPPDTLLIDYPNIKIIHTLSAGADHLGQALLTSGLPICRIVDNQQKHGMLEYILWGILNYQRDFEQYRRQQSQNHWQSFRQRYAREITVTLLGLGEIGAYVAEQLAQFGYSVNGWNRTQKHLSGVACFTGHDHLDSILKSTNVLINLLPLTSETQGILCKPLFEKMPVGAFLINCGRGGHLITDDLVSAIESQWLKGALLDVFEEEPLAPNSPFWSQQNVIITPHIASSSSIATIVSQVVENMNLFENGLPLNNRL